MIDTAFAQRLGEDILKDVLTSPIKRFDRWNRGNIISDFEFERSRILGTVLSNLWDQLMTECKGYEDGKRLLVSEKALACLLRRGASLESRNMGSYFTIIRLNAISYFVDKKDDGFSAGPCVMVCTFRHTSLVTLTGDEFADFMFEFDSLVPWIEQRVDEFLMDDKIMALQYRIICQTAYEFGDRLLTPHCIKWDVDTDFSETAISISFRDEVHVPICETISADKFFDTFQKIPQRMELQPKIDRMEPFNPFDG